MSFDPAISSSWYVVSTRAALRDGPREVPFCGSAVRVSDDDAPRVEPVHGGAPLPTLCQDGLVMAWYGPAGGEPRFRPAPTDTTGWTTRTFDMLPFKSRPDLVMRDLADIEHFSSVHLYQSIHESEPFRTDGPECSLTLDFGWPLVPKTPLTLPSRFQSKSTGVGYQVTQVSSLGGLLVSRHLVLPTPVDRDTIHVTLGLDLRAAGPLGRVLANALHPMIRAAFRRDVRMDAELWQALHRGEPSLESDALTRFETWAAQFAAA